MQRTKMVNSSSYQGGSSSNPNDVIAKETKRVLNAPSIEHLLARNGKNEDLANVKINQNKIILTRRSSERTEREIRSIMHYFRLSRYKMNTKFELECWEIDNKGMEVLGFQISRHLSNLQELSLAFSACWEITDKGVEILISQIARSLVNLKRLSLDFSACEQITDKAVKVIGSEICKHMINLQRLNLDFHNCVEITDTGVKALGSEITRRLVKLQQLGLICNSCSQITNQSIQILGSDIARRLANLHRLSLIFSSSKVTLQCKQKLRTLLRFIPSIRIY